jgi:Cu-Zn family superoxide dismutase
MMGNMASMPMTAPNITAAIVVLTPTQGNDVHGTIKFSKVAGGIRVVADVTGLKPGLHGFHVHDYGDITSNNADSAGGHFNPAHEIHGGPPAEHRNVGDLGNINADASGHATIDYVNEKLAFEGPASIIGRAVVIHADPDDYNAQPGGNAGAKIAYGVIGIAKGP